MSALATGSSHKTLRSWIPWNYHCHSLGRHQLVYVAAAAHCQPWFFLLGWLNCRWVESTNIFAVNLPHFFHVMTVLMLSEAVANTHLFRNSDLFAWSIAASVQLIKGKIHEKMVFVWFWIIAEGLWHKLYIIIIIFKKKKLTLGRTWKKKKGLCLNWAVFIYLFIFSPI